MTSIRPLPYGYDSLTALLVVDVQNDFADQAGSLFVSGGLDIPAIVNAEIGAGTDAGSLVVYTQDWHPPTTPHFAKDGGVWPVHCVAGTWGAELHPDLRVAGPRVQKGTRGEDGYSGFTVRDPRTDQRHATNLEDILRQAGAETVVIMGLATDYCVKDTALDALSRGFRVVVPRHVTRAVNLSLGDGDRAFVAMGEAGAQIL